MIQKYLVDTCIWRDFYEDRISRSGRPLGEYAAEFFMKVILRKDKIIFSESLVWELKRDYDWEEVNGMLNFLFANNVLVKIEIEKGDHLEAKKLSENRKIPYVDCLNAVLSRNHNATIITQDKHYKKELADIAKTTRPEDVT